MLSVSLCSFFNEAGRGTRQLRVAQRKRGFENRVGALRTPGSYFFAMDAILT